jgi:hypothetical protein
MELGLQPGDSDSRINPIPQVFKGDPQTPGLHPSPIRWPWNQHYDHNNIKMLDVLPPCWHCSNDPSWAQSKATYTQKPMAHMPSLLWWRAAVHRVLPALGVTGLGSLP